MEASTIGLIIGGFNVILYSISGIFFLYFAVHSDFLVGLCVLIAILSLVIVAVSGLLVMGILKKRYILMAPWVYSVNILNIAISIAFASIPKIDPNDNSSDVGITIAFNFWYGLMIWIPIYFLYQEIRCDNINDQEPRYPVRGDYEQVP